MRIASIKTIRYSVALALGSRAQRPPTCHLCGNVDKKRAAYVTSCAPPAPRPADTLALNHFLPRDICPEFDPCHPTYSFFKLRRSVLDYFYFIHFFF